ncbi:MAG: hypothetical protein NZ700_15880, partial [Gemmataceae bacterium]|nr:hypothetical protein [Gemmataceae bacterium]
DNPDVDLDLTLDRGLIMLENHKEQGAARVRLRVGKEIWDFTLNEPKTAVGMELFGRWAAGILFQKEPTDPPEEPAINFGVLVLEGSVDVHHRQQQHHMHAPPGPAALVWNSSDTEELRPLRLERLPRRATPEGWNTPHGMKMLAALYRLRDAIVEKSLDTALANGLKSTDPNTRFVTVTALGAFDDLPRLIDALSAPQADVRERAVTVLRNWIGRGPGQDARLYQALLDKGFKPAHAEIVMNGLHSFSDEQRQNPELYEILIAYLMHEVPAIRQLASWHLYRLVPAGKDIAYDPLAPEADRAAAHDAWKKLIPDGKLPPKVKSEKGKEGK